MLTESEQLVSSTEVLNNFAQPERHPNVFNFFRDVSRTVIAPYLDAASLAALTEASWSTSQIFKDQLNLREDAHVIMQEALNGTPESLRAVLEEARKTQEEGGKGYGANVGILLLTPTRGFEGHCKREWKNETVIRLAANAGDLYQWIYDLHPPLKDREEIAAGNIHVAIENLDLTKKKLLRYTVLTPTGEQVTDYITEEELHCSLTDPLNKQLLKIMAITFKRGHTTNKNLAHPEIARTYLLNIVFDFIPDQYRQLAILQLQHIRKHGTEHGEVLSAFNEMDASYMDHINHFKERTWVKSDEYWRTVVGCKQGLLPKFGLQLLCDPIPWDPMPDFKNLPAPHRDARLNDGTAFFPVLPSWLGSSGAIEHYGGPYRYRTKTNNIALVAEGAGTRNRDVMHRGCQVRLAQLDAFIGEQIRLDVEYKQQKLNLHFNRR